MTAAQFCSTCGATVRTVPRPGRFQRLRDWFLLDDRHRGDRYECENGHGWTSFSHTYSSGAPRPSLRGVFRELEGHRTHSPVPATYAMASGAGLLLGLAMRALFGWRWWPGALMAPVAAWTAATATAFGSTNRADTVFGLRNQLDPAGGYERHLGRRRTQLAEVDFVVYRLADQRQSPSLGGTGGSNGKLHQVTLTHGDARDDSAPVIDVSTSGRPETLGYLKHIEEEELRCHVAGPAHLESSDPSVYQIDIDWSDIFVTIDGAMRPAVVVELRESWSVIVADVADGWVIIRGRNSEVPRPLNLEPAELQESMV